MARLAELGRILADAAALDPFDLAFDETSAIAVRRARSGFIVERPLAVSVGRFLRDAVRSLAAPEPASEPNPAPGAILFYAGSRNQADVLGAVAGQIEGACCFSAIGRGFAARLPAARIYGLGLLLAPLAVRAYLTSRGQARASFRTGGDRYARLFGLYVLLRLRLRRWRPSIVVVANDHTFDARTVVKAVRDEGIATAYVQHAQISDEFPPLAVDYAFLDGIDSAEKYDRPGSRALVFLTGSPKFAGARRNTADRVRTVGVCCNQNDAEAPVGRVVRAIGEAFPDLGIVFRPHPLERRGFEDARRVSGVAVSDAVAETSVRFLSRCDAIVTGDSSIAAEALYLNVATVLYRYGPNFRDHYGFVRNGALDLVTEPADLHDRLRSWMARKPDVRAMARRYYVDAMAEDVAAPADTIAALLRTIASDRGSIDRMPLDATFRHLRVVDAAAYVARSGAGSP